MSLSVKTFVTEKFNFFHFFFFVLGRRKFFSSVKFKQVNEIALERFVRSINIYNVVISIRLLMVHFFSFFAKDRENNLGNCISLFSRVIRLWHKMLVNVWKRVDKDTCAWFFLCLFLWKWMLTIANKVNKMNGACMKFSVAFL